jgi:hypothetical protein
MMPLGRRAHSAGDAKGAPAGVCGGLTLMHLMQYAVVEMS